MFICKMRGALILAALIAVAASETETASETDSTYKLILGEPVELVIVPDAVYCILEDPHNIAFNEGFGPCTIRLDRVTEQHAGMWEALIFRKDGTEAEHLTFEIITLPRPQVHASVTIDKENDEVTINCQVNFPGDLNFCKFRSDNNQLFLFRHSQEEEVEGQRYIYLDTFENNTTEINNKGRDGEIYCGLKIKGPQKFDFGRWRCGMEITGDVQSETLFGFVNIKDFHRVDEASCTPTLTPRNTDVYAVEDTSFSMSCRMNAKLDFCFFRGPDGTIYNVESGRSSLNYEYIGEGLDAGDCGIRLHDADITHNGQWTCNVGNKGKPFTKEILVHVQGIDISYVTDENSLSITANLRSEQSGTITRCRFVHATGMILTDKAQHAGFHVRLYNNQCTLWRDLPSSIDLEPWLVGVRVQGYMNEFTQLTSRTVFPDLPSSTPRPPTGGNGSWSFYFVWRMFFGLLIIGFMLTLIGLMLKDTNRKWSTRRNNNNINNQNVHANSNIVTVDHDNSIPNYQQANSDPRIVDEKHNLP